MKYVNNGIIQNVIKDSDINLSESFQNQNLADVLTQYKEDLNTLKSNVKWLAKYGGVGGSGGSGGSGGTSGGNVKLKYRVDITYTDNADNLNSQQYSSNTKNNKILIKENTYAKVSVTLERCLPNTTYQILMQYGEQTYRLKVDSLSLTTSQNIYCLGNSDLTITVYATPEDMPSTTIKVLTQVRKVEFNLVQTTEIGDIIIPDGSIVYQEDLEQIKLKGKIINYVPDLAVFNGVSQILVNGNQINYTVVENQGEFYEYIITPDNNDIFSAKGIYEIQMDYVFNNVQETIKKVYVYKDERVFVYCYGETNVVYTDSNIQDPITSNFNVENIKVKIYPKKSDDSSAEYNISWTVDYEGKSSDQSFSKSDSWKAFSTHDVKFANIYSERDFSDSSSYKRVTITFTVEGTSYVYYVYVSKLNNAQYIFSHNGNLFYNALHSSTATINDDLSKITTFPFEQGQFKQLTEAETHLITKFSDKTSMPYANSVYGQTNENGLSGGYVTNHSPANNAQDSDVLLSFGLKYSEFNLELPILDVKINKVIQGGVYQMMVSII